MVRTLACVQARPARSLRRSFAPPPRQKSLAASRGALEASQLVMMGSPLTSCVSPRTAASWPTWRAETGKEP